MIITQTIKTTCKHWYILCLVFTLASTPIFGQVTINIPAQITGGYTLQELSQTSYINSSGRRYGSAYANITVNNITDGQSFTLRTASFNINVGSSIPGYSVLAGSTVINPSSDYYELEQNGKFPAGIYSLCINLYDERGNLLGKQCISLNVINAGAIVLISPTDEEVLNTFNPMFNWLPLKAPDNKYKYNIHIAELLPGQSYGDAISQNPPLVYEMNISGSSFSYPSGAPQLEDGKQYVWQIEADLQGHSMIYSEIWMFQYKKSNQPPIIKKTKPPVAYPYVTRSLSSAYYEYSDTINFKYINYQNDTLLTYCFKLEGKADTLKIPKLSVKIRPLVNYLRIPVADEMKAPKKKAVYKLEIRNSRNEIWMLHFIINKKKKD